MGQNGSLKRKASGFDEIDGLFSREEMANMGLGKRANLRIVEEVDERPPGDFSDIEEIFMGIPRNAPATKTPVSVFKKVATVKVQAEPIKTPDDEEIPKGNFDDIAQKFLALAGEAQPKAKPEKPAEKTIEVPPDVPLIGTMAHEIEMEPVTAPDAEPKAEVQSEPVVEEIRPMVHRGVIDAVPPRRGVIAWNPVAPVCRECGLPAHRSNLCQRHWTTFVIKKANENVQ